MASGDLRRTALYPEHVKLNAKMVPFGGWEMPVYYTGIVNEHQAVRHAVGIFDISHMGEIEVFGAEAEAWLNGLLTNNLAKLALGEGQYTLMLNNEGGVIDDLIVYRLEQSHFFLVVNAANNEEDFLWLSGHRTGEVTLLNRSDHFAAVAVQGPKSPDLFRPIGELPQRNRIRPYRLGPVQVLIARTGYTGEDGFEAFFPAESAVAIWNQFLDLGKPWQLLPCGLGARDTLRLEACYPLNGADLSPERTPVEAGLGFFVDLTKHKFIGREPLLKQKTHGVNERLCAIRLAPKAAPPRAHYAVYVENEQIGELTSGTQSPTLGAGIGLGYLRSSYAKPGQALEVEVRGRRFPATVEKKPLYKRPC
ncbi:MAG TPA: glycine cleavage system aminomethyltransferase GcvT [Chthoniobacterales bacterium]|nr:glycine cleavage system aminomethyltransferase GcvT [Chthoniobacterales bacterium]